MTTPSPRGSPCPRGFSLCSHLLQLAPDFVSVDPSPKYGPVPRLCASNTMGHAVGRSAFLSIAISIISLLLFHLWDRPPRGSSKWLLIRRSETTALECREART